MATAAKPANNKFLTFIFVLSLMRDVMIVFLYILHLYVVMLILEWKESSKGWGPIVL